MNSLLSEVFLMRVQSPGCAVALKASCSVVGECWQGSGSGGKK